MIEQSQTFYAAQPPIYRSIDLTTARTAEAIPVAEVGSDGFFCDYRTDGEATLHIQEASAYGFPVKAQAGLRVAFNRLFITNTAQAGKTLHLWIGRGIHFVQPNADITSIDLIREITPPSLATPYGVFGVASTLQTIVAPASNTAGIRINRATITAVQANSVSRLMTKTAAPSGVSDTAAGTLLYASSAAPLQHSEAEVIVPAGQGLYFQTTDSASTSSVMVDYEVLS